MNCGASVGPGQTTRTNQSSIRQANRQWILWTIGLGTLILVIIIQSS